MRPFTASVAVSLFTPYLLIACSQQVSRHAPGLTARGIEALRAHMTPEQVSASLGNPLWSGYDAPPGSGKRLSVYAEHGGWRVLGSQSTLVGNKGIDLTLTFQDEELAQVWFVNHSADAMCACTQERCDVGWAQRCLVGIQW